MPPSRLIAGGQSTHNGDAQTLAAASVRAVRKQIKKDVVTATVQEAEPLAVLDDDANGILTALTIDGLQPFTSATVEASQLLEPIEASRQQLGKKGGKSSRRCAQKWARLQAMVAERAAWTEPLAQSKHLHGWLLDVEHLLDTSLVPQGDVAKNVTVGSRRERWRERMSAHLTDGSLAEVERECLSEFFQVLSHVRSHLVQCYDRQDVPRTVPRQGAQHSRPQDAVLSGERSQEREELSVALRARGGRRGVGGARCGPSSAPATAGRST